MLFKIACIAAALLLCMPLLAGCSQIGRVMRLIQALSSPEPTAAASTEEPKADDTAAPAETAAAPEPTPEPTATPEPEMPPAPLAFSVARRHTVASGYMLCGAVSKTGELWVWKDKNGRGINYEVVSEQEPISAMRGVASVYGAGAFLLALKTDGTLWYVGSDDPTEPFLIADGVEEAAGGGDNSAFIRFDGALFIVKNRDLEKQRGNAPVTKIMEGAKAVSCGGGFFAAIKTDGSLWTWGNNEHGQLGDGTAQYRAEPVRIMDHVRCVDCTDRSAVAVTEDGKAYVWGYSGTNTVWEDTNFFYNTPTLAMTDVRSAVCSESYGRTLLVMKGSDSLWLWSTTPEPDGRSCASNSFLLMDGCAAFCFGSGVVLLLKDDGSLWVCGYYSHRSGSGEYSVLCRDERRIMTDIAIPEK